MTTRRRLVAEEPAQPEPEPEQHGDDEHDERHDHEISHRSRVVPARSAIVSSAAARAIIHPSMDVLTIPVGTSQRSPGCCTLSGLDQCLFRNAAKTAFPERLLLF